MEREAIIEALKNNPEVDVLIIGAGINGAGAFLDMAVNGLNVVLIDRGDFCSGASATSSHMAHGGIRYLENGEFRLVREAVAERNRMIRNSPHMVKPLPTVIPMFKLFSGLLNAPLKFFNLLDKPSERGAMVIKIGLMFYDSFTGKNRTVPAHQFFGKRETFKRYPRLNKEAKYSAEYYDGLILSPERLNTEIVIEAEKASEKAWALNYATFNSVENGYALVNDLETKQTIKIKPKVIVNASGPWIDYVNMKMGVDSKYIGGTKGSHIIVNNPELKAAIGEKEFFFENKDGRIVLLLPFFDKVIIGTSDLSIENPDNAVCTPEEEMYFIDLVKRVFPDIPILPDQIVFRFSGVRPLEYQHAKTTGQITRDHTIKEDKLDDIPVLSLVGGKWTSYRAFSEQVTEKTLGILAKSRIASTDEIRIGGGRDYPDSEETVTKYLERFTEYGSIDLLRLLFDRYGSTIEQIIAQKTVETLDSSKEITISEISYLAETEKVVHLDDLLLRRTSIGWLGLVNPVILGEISDIVGEVLCWNTGKKSMEIERTKELFLKNHGVAL